MDEERAWQAYQKAGVLLDLLTEHRKGYLEGWLAAGGTGFGYPPGLRELDERIALALKECNRTMVAWREVFDSQQVVP